MAAPVAAASQPSTNTSQTNLPLPATPRSLVPAAHQHQTPHHRHSQQQPPQRPQVVLNTLPQPSHPAGPASATSPSKPSLTNWWKGIKSKAPFRKGEEQEIAPKGIFGVSLNTSIQYAYVNISITNESGKSEVYGRIPVIVAKCGIYLKDKATDVEGIFRVSGSEKRIKELQNYFDSPPTYGKNLEWDGFNVHDAANVFRRYINHLPEPIIPIDYYFAFRQPLEKAKIDVEPTILLYQKLIGALPKLNGQLLLYILDLLAVFAENSQANLMPTSNLAAIFQPGLLSHPDHDMHPKEYKVSQEVLIFLIQHQDRFIPATTVKPDQIPTPPMEKRSTIAIAASAAPPPARYQQAQATEPPRDVSISRRHTMSKKPNDSSPTIGRILRRHKSTRSPQRHRLAVEEEEPRRVSEGSTPGSPHTGGYGDEDGTPLIEPHSRRDRASASDTTGRQLRHYEDRGRDHVVSLSEIPSTQSAQTEQPSTTTGAVDLPAVDSPGNVKFENVSTSEPNHVIAMRKASDENDGVTKGTFLTSSPARLGRSSSYREQFDDVECDQTTSTDNTEAEASDADKSEKKQQRRSRLPWASSPDIASPEAKFNNFLSFSPASAGEENKSSNKLKKKKKPKNGDIHGNVTGIAVTDAVTEPLNSLPLANSQPDEGVGMLSPKPWTEQSNISHSSLRSSNYSRQSHISSNRSSFEIPRRPVTPTERPAASMPPPTTFAAIRQRSLVEGAQTDGGDSPIQVITGASGSEKPRSNSHGSAHSAGSSGKVPKIGAWRRNKSGISMSSSTSAGGGGSAVGD